MNRQEQIAKTILEQLIVLGGDWMQKHSSQVIVALPESRAIEGGILFHVTGKIHTGMVAILLEWDDTYTVAIVDDNAKVIELVQDVFFDVLVPVLDGLVNGE